MSSKIKLLLAIPTLNRADLLNEALSSYFVDFPTTEIVICDNGNQELLTREEKFVVYKPGNNLDVSGSWNMLMDYAVRVDATHVLMLNDDVVLGKTEQQIRLLLEAYPHYDFYNSEKNWCSFILPITTFKKIGEFDQNRMPNYFNDNDYCYRMRLAGMSRLNIDFLNPVIYRNSMTIEKNPSLNNHFMEYRQNFINKWGGEPGQEKFITPYNS
jgi:GT2 family glycosyltransferase